MAHIELHRPDALNAWTPELGAELLHAIAAGVRGRDGSAILLTGAGRAFSAGADLKASRSVLPNGDPDLSSRLHEIYNPVILAVRAAPKPVVGAIQGASRGLGCSLAAGPATSWWRRSPTLSTCWLSSTLPSCRGRRRVAIRRRTGRAAPALPSSMCMLGDGYPQPKGVRGRGLVEPDGADRRGRHGGVRRWRPDSPRVRPWHGEHQEERPRPRRRRWPTGWRSRPIASRTAAGLLDYIEKAGASFVGGRRQRQPRPMREANMAGSRARRRRRHFRSDRRLPASAAGLRRRRAGSVGRRSGEDRVPAP